MDDTIITIYCLCDDFLKALLHYDDPQVRFSSAEVMTIPLVAATFFGGNIDKTRRFLVEYGYMKKMISKSRLNRRLHAIKPEFWQALLAVLAEVLKSTMKIKNLCSRFSTSASVRQHIRIRRCRIYPLEEEGYVDDDPAKEKKKSFRGYIASKWRYFYGLRVHLVVSGAGQPVEFSLAACSEGDVKVFKELELDLPESSMNFADKAYTDYEYEDLLKEVGLQLKAQRKKNSKRTIPAWEEFLSKPIRKYIESDFSQLTNFFPKKIHTVTPRGFELKIVFFLLAFSVQCL